MDQIPALILLSSFLSIGAFVFSQILTSPEHILGALDAWLERNLPEDLYKPVIGCQYCVAGQWALWEYLALSFITREIHYRPDVHILFILFCIFLEEPITYLYNNILKK